MTRISKKQAYPIKKPVLRDYFVGTDSEDNLKTVSYDFESVAALVASINGDSVISYTYSNNPNLGITEQDAGYFLSFNDETSFPLIAKLFVSNRSMSNALMTNLFGFIKDNASNFSLKLRNAANPNNIAYLNIDSVENHGTYYTFNISVYNVNYIGELENGAVYIFDFVIKNDDLVLLLPEFNKITFDAGFSLIGQNLNINTNCQWIITNNAYSNVAPVVLNIPFAAAGKQRIDLILANSFNTFQRLSGPESIGTPVRPNKLTGTIEYTFCLVSDTAIEEIPPPDLSAYATINYVDAADEALSDRINALAIAKAPFSPFKFLQKGFGNIDLTNNQIGDIFSGWSNDGTIRITEGIWLGGPLNDSDSFIPLVQTSID